MGRVKDLRPESRAKARDIWNDYDGAFFDSYTSEDDFGQTPLDSKFNYFPSPLNERQAAYFLHNAVLNNDLHLVKDLLNSGANPNIKDPETGKYPIVLAMEHCYTRIFKALLENSKTNIKLNQVIECAKTNGFNLPDRNSRWCLKNNSRSIFSGYFWSFRECLSKLYDETTLVRQQEIRNSNSFKLKV